MKITRFRFCWTLVALVCVWPVFSFLSGCEIFASHTNPILGWHARIDQVEQLSKNKAINDDYQAYIKKLSLTQRDFIGEVGYLEDGTGQHAVTIEIGSNGTYWTHVLIYDRDDKRIGVKKYVSGHYAC